MIIAGFYNENGFEICEVVNGERSGNVITRADGGGAQGIASPIMAIRNRCETTGEMIAAATGNQFAGTREVEIE